VEFLGRVEFFGMVEFLGIGSKSEREKIIIKQKKIGQKANVLLMLSL